MTTTQNLDDSAKTILASNDKGKYTIPTFGLYPYQWNWDSAFAAFGFAQFNVDRAWLELMSGVVWVPFHRPALASHLSPLPWRDLYMKKIPLLVRNVLRHCSKSLLAGTNGLYNGGWTKVLFV